MTAKETAGRLAELHRRRSAIDAEIAELYLAEASGETPKRKRRQHQVIVSDPPKPEILAEVKKRLARQGIK